MQVQDKLHYSTAKPIAIHILLCKFKVSYITVRLSLAIYILLCKFKVSYNYYCEVKPSIYILLGKFKVSYITVRLS